MVEEKYVQLIARELGLPEAAVINTIELLETGATIPFIARYRKEATGSLDEVEVMHIRDRLHRLKELDKRRLAIRDSLVDQEVLTPELEARLLQATTLTELEDIYLPYRPKRKTRATIARTKGLEPLAKMLMVQNDESVQLLAKRFVNPAKEVATEEEALAGARDIMAEWINENSYCRNRIRQLFQREAIIKSQVAKGKEAEGMKYRNYYDFQESISKSPSHRVLAMLRGEHEGYLRLSVAPPEARALPLIEQKFVRNQTPAAQEVKKAIKDAYKRLLQPAIETEMRNWARQRADEKAIQVFAENLRQLLMAAPLGEKNVLAIDPGFRTGCKVVCLDRRGRLLHNETIYPHPPQSKVRPASKKILSLVDAYKIEAIAIGNGTAGRETERFVKFIPFKKEMVVVMVNESGASVYSASAVAREEFPDYDVTVRGSVSIGRRLMDPLAELVKIDPKSIGVGQYQHDVEQHALSSSLDDVVMSCVNKVGVEVNTASKQLLTYVSGVGPTLAKNIVDYREQNGLFDTREDLKKVARFGPKAFEQAAGFLRIRNGSNPLDYSAVHPESYGLVKRMAKALNTSVAELMSNTALSKQIRLEDFVTPTTGLPTLKDIVAELAKPGRDPREKFGFFEFDKNVHSIDDLVEGMILPGIVTNITAFGAFVDVGVHQDGLVHVSHLANRFIKDPNEVVKLNQKVRVKVISVEKERKRIQLSMKEVHEEA